MALPELLVAFTPRQEERDSVEEVLGSISNITYLNDLPREDRAEALKRAELVFARRIRAELSAEELALLSNARFFQEHGAGVDFMPYDQLPVDAVIASNAGATGEPIAEHVVALILASYKRLLPNHHALAQNDFPQGQLNRALRGAVCGILGFGGIGKCTANLLRPFGTKIHAINTSGKTDEQVDWVGTLDDLETFLRAVDIVVISIPNTRATRGMFNAETLGWMKPDALLVNVSRAAQIDQTALYEHLTSHPDFMVALDAWWLEPMRQGVFKIEHPFFDLPNFVGSPHNSSAVPGLARHSSRLATQNIRRFIQGEPVNGLARREDYME